MTNQEIARVFLRLADLLEMKGENPFKVQAYRRAARTIKHLHDDVETMVAEGMLDEVPGVGEAIAKKMAELAATGSLEAYERAKAEFPPGVPDLLELPGVGPKTALFIVNELDIKSPTELGEAIRSGRLTELPHMGKERFAELARYVGADKGA